MGHVRHLELVDLDAVVDRVVGRVAPTWPLDRFIAVNPLWGFVAAPLPEVAARLAALGGARLTPTRAWFREQWAAGRFGEAHVRRALDEAGAPSSSLGDTLAAMREEPAPAPRRLRVTDLGEGWAEHVVEDLSRRCAAWFDEGQAVVAPSRDGGLYGSWRRTVAGDLHPTLWVGRARWRDAVAALPEPVPALISGALAALRVPAREWEAYLTSLLLDVSGWAAWCAYRRWTARLDGGDDEALVELLAARLGWEWALLDAAGPPLAARWEEAVASWPAVDEAARRDVDWVLQRAVELALHEGIERGLAEAPTRARRVPAVQAAFCIDVRSEVYRRALESRSVEVDTIGFAGFFGLPIEYRAVGAASGVPQLPGLLAPRLRATDVGVAREVAEQRTRRLDARAAWKRFKHAALSGFSFVEVVGLLYGPKLVGDALGLTRPTAAPERAGLTESEHAARKPRLTERATGEPLAVAERVELAAGILRGMSLTSGFARLVALVGHGSRSVNNPHASGLDCGACCGRSGEVNARAVAALLNEPEVREGLRGRGVALTEATWFVAALHDTTTDEVGLFDLDEVPATHAPDVATLRAWLDAASERARAERAPRLGLGGLDGPALRRALEARANDWSQVRPEWGLAGNAAFVIAARERSRHLDLGGRSFLHDYRWDEDEDGSVLEGILTAPMVVTHWINFQYYASAVDNVRFGSGNKVLHNVVGGGIGVLEGTGGDLRIGLPFQSVHDGERLVHEPIRLGVFVEAPRARVEAIVARHETVRHLVEHGWVHLYVIDPADA